MGSFDPHEPHHAAHNIRHRLLLQDGGALTPLVRCMMQERNVQNGRAYKDVYTGLKRTVQCTVWAKAKIYRYDRNETNNISARTRCGFHTQLHVCTYERQVLYCTGEEESSQMYRNDMSCPHRPVSEKWTAVPIKCAQILVGFWAALGRDQTSTEGTEHRHVQGRMRTSRITRCSKIWRCVGTRPEARRHRSTLGGVSRREQTAGRFTGCGCSAVHRRAKSDARAAGPQSA